MRVILSVFYFWGRIGVVEEREDQRAITRRFLPHIQRRILHLVEVLRHSGGIDRWLLTCGRNLGKTWH